MSRTKAHQSEITQHQLVQVARRLFAERGYSDIGTEEIVRAAQVTRGALYHHYRNKHDLFAAVVEAVMRDIHTALLAAAAPAKGDLWRALELGVEAFLDMSQQPEVLSIAFRDAPAVLGWQHWRELDARYGLGVLQTLFGGLMHKGLVKTQPVKPLAHLVLGALTEAALMIGNAPDPAMMRAEVAPSLRQLLDGLRLG